MSNINNIWVLLDDAAGHMNQALGVAEALGLPFEPKTIKYNSKAKLPNLLLGASLKAISPKEAAQIKAPWPDLIISAGRKTYPVARYIKKRSLCTRHSAASVAKSAESRGGDPAQSLCDSQDDGTKKYGAKLVQIMHPGFPAWGIDLLVVPEHDGLRPNKRTLVTLGAPNRVQPDFLAQEASIWEKTLEKLPHPRLAVMLGGNTKGIEFTKEDGEMLAIRVQQLTKWEGSLLISSSRRTPKIFVESFLNDLKQPYHFHDPAIARTNPYYAFLALSKAVIVTADSVSMMSEACATGKPVYVYKPQHFQAQKHNRLLQSLLSGGYLQMIDNISATPNKKLETNTEIALRIRQLLS